MDGSIVNTTVVKLEGPLFNGKMASRVPVVIEGILHKVGETGVGEMRAITKESDFTKTLTESMMWRTQKRTSKVDTSYKIPAPPMANAVDVGSAAPYAWYREYGAGVHITNDKSEEFLDNMRIWAIEKLHIDPEVDRAQFWGLIKHIRSGEKAQRKEQGKTPFLAPFEARLPLIAKTIIEDVLRVELVMLDKQGGK